MDKNTLTGLLLMGLVVFGFLWCGRKDPEQTKNDTEQTSQTVTQEAPDPNAWKISQEDLDAYNQVMGSAELKAMASNFGSLRLTGVDSTSYVVVGGARVPLDSVLANNATPNGRAAVKAFREDIRNLQSRQHFAPMYGGVDSTIVIDRGDQMKVAFSTKGAQIVEVELKKYKVETSYRKGNVTLFSPQLDNNKYYFTLKGDGRTFDTDDLYFTPEMVNDTTVTMKLDFGAGRYWGLKYTVCPSEYIVKMDIIQSGADEVLNNKATSMDFNWRQQVVRNEEGRTFEERNSCVMYKYVDDSPEDLDASGTDKEDLKEKVKWVAFKNQFFSSVIVARTAFTSGEVESRDLKDGGNPTLLKDMRMKGTFSYSTGDENPAGFDFYFGPNSYSMLSDLDGLISPKEDLTLTKLVPLGWGLFGWINRFLVIPVFNFLGSFGWNYGIIILLLTIFIKIILFPFTYKSYISQAKMRVLAPEIKEINEKYPGTENALKRQQETMALYSRAGASPFSGCLPLLLQMPILIAMFSFFPSCIELRGQSFLWCHDLSAPDYICALPFRIPFYGDHVSLFCLLMTVVNIIYTRINMQNQAGGNTMPGMKWMMYLMPVMFLFFFNDYAAGLSYYYFLSLLITIVQTWIFRKVIDEKKVREKMMENAKKPKKKSGFMARLEEAQRRQQAMLREQQAKQNKNRRR